MLERRRVPRNRVYYGGVVAFNDRRSTLTCIVRNFTREGARIEFDGPVLLPDRVDVLIQRKDLACPARLVWCDRDAAGLAFAETHEAGEVVSLSWARRLHDSERANRRLQSRLDQLLSEY